MNKVLILLLILFLVLILILILICMFINNYYWDQDEIEKFQNSASAIAYIKNGSVSKIKLTSSGSEYSSAPQLLFVGVCTHPAQAFCSISGGKISNIIITDIGKGYVNPPVIEFIDINNEIFKLLKDIKQLLNEQNNVKSKELSTKDINEYISQYNEMFNNINNDNTKKKTDLKKQINDMQAHIDKENKLKDFNSKHNIKNSDPPALYTVKDLNLLEIQYKNVDKPVIQIPDIDKVNCMQLNKDIGDLSDKIEMLSVQAENNKLLTLKIKTLTTQLDSMRDKFKKCNLN